MNGLRGSLMGRVILLALAAAALYAVGSMFASSFQRSLTFYPIRESSESLDAQAAENGLERWRNAEGKPIGWVTREGNAANPLVVFHGNAGFAAYRAGLARAIRQWAPQTNWKIHILEYPGYGDRPGKPSESAFLDAALEALSTFPEDNPPVVLGESIGTGTASLAAGRAPERVKGLILLTPFSSLVEVAAHHYPFLPVRWIMVDRFESARALENFPGPVAFLIGGADTITPPRLGRQLHDLYEGPKILLEARGAGHNEVATALGPDRWKQALDFASSPVK